MKVNIRKEFRPYSISVESSKDHQDLLRIISDALSKYGNYTIGGNELKQLKETLIKTQAGGE